MLNNRQFLMQWSLNCNRCAECRGRRNHLDSIHLTLAIFTSHDYPAEFFSLGNESKVSLITHHSSMEWDKPKPDDKK